MKIPTSLGNISSPQKTQTTKEPFFIAQLVSAPTLWDPIANENKATSLQQFGMKPITVLWILSLSPFSLVTSL